MTMKLSNKQIKRIAKTIKGLGAKDVDWDETFEQDEASAEFQRGEVKLIDYQEADDFENGYAYFSDDMILAGRDTYWVLMDEDENELDTYGDKLDIPREYMWAMKEHHLSPDNLI